MRLPSLFYLALFFSFICLLLGLWQWQRLSWKENLLAQIETKCQTRTALAPALPPQQEWRHLDKALWAWQKVQFSARLQKESVQLWHQGQFITIGLAKLDGGGTILIQQPKQNYRRTTYQAVLYPSQQRRFFDVKDRAEKGIYYVRDIEKIAKRLSPLAPVFPFIAELSLICPNVPNRHFNYMITWFLLMLLLPIVAIFGKKEK